DACRAFRDAGKLALGVCNGFQVLIKTGLLDVEDAAGDGGDGCDPGDGAEPLATLTWNDHGRYEARWVTLDATPGECVFLRGVERIELPIAHAEGRIAVRDDAALDTLARRGQVVLRYADPASDAVANDAVLPFPANPNGAAGNAAALCDTTGRVLGLMPHPERFLFATQHPKWTRLAAAGEIDPRGEGAGLRLFRNAVDHFA
ncbi:MAG: phosphoribosylformylglycinamidine synthase subunit PurQ, partial [Planctomycetota bacterium]